MKVLAPELVGSAFRSTLRNFNTTMKFMIASAPIEAPTHHQNGVLLGTVNRETNIPNNPEPLKSNTNCQRFSRFRTLTGLASAGIAPESVHHDSGVRSPKVRAT
jgi:hypothetical protein